MTNLQECQDQGSIVLTIVERFEIAKQDARTALIGAKKAKKPDAEEIEYRNAICDWLEQLEGQFYLGIEVETTLAEFGY